ncbi:MAG: hypothetical protein ABSB28_00300 [Candidatus Bathyarchaeia archaeon]
MKKYLIGLLVSAMIVTSLLGAAFILNVKGDTSSDYLQVQGVLNTDTYLLYPYTNSNMTIGFSKYGEMTNPYTGNGMNYSGKDPFANEGVLQQYWVQGWELNARYVHRVYGGRNLWAFAEFSDLIQTGGDWVNMATNPYGAPYGGRKTSGIATTDPIIVLYNGPREFVAQLTTHLNDTTLGTSWRVLDVVFTIIFEKDKKEVTVLKDIKLTMDEKILSGPVDVMFSNRGEWDLGPSPDWKSYVHFWHDTPLLTTPYDVDYTLALNITREYVYSNTSWNSAYTGLNLVNDIGGHPWYGPPVVSFSEFVYVNGLWQKNGKNYTLDYNTGQLTWLTVPATGSGVEIYFKLYRKPNEYNDAYTVSYTTPGRYDLAQVIARDNSSVGFEAFWPILSDYTPDGWTTALLPIYNTSDPDMVPASKEPDIPFIIGQWDFMLDYTTAQGYGKQFRGVSVIGLVDHHDADDTEMAALLGGTHHNTPDREALFQLNEVFNPWDLVSAVEKKDTRSWVEFLYGYTSYALKHTPVVKVDDNYWDQYAEFTERVECLETGKLLHRYALDPVHGSLKDYSFSVDSYTGIATISGLNASLHYKVLYSTNDYWLGSYILLDINSVTNQALTGSPISLFSKEEYGYITDTLGVKWAADLHNLAVSFQNKTTNSFSTPEAANIWFTPSSYYNEFKVFFENTAILTNYENFPATMNNSASANFNLTATITDPITYSVSEPYGNDTVHVHYFDPQIHVYAAAVSNGTHYNMTWYVEITNSQYYLYNEEIGGRYEWATVGRDSKPIDSIGTSLVTAAFKDKQVEVGNAGLDMIFTESGVQSAPNIMSKSGSGSSWADYYMSGDTTVPGNRTGLSDDWCTYWPVSTSNLISVGGPLANMLTYYTNDYEPALYGISWYTPYGPWNGAVDALTCWSKNAYFSSNTTGYAVISTYLDINGTEIFNVWGVWGRDTFYACQWLAGDVVRNPVTTYYANDGTTEYYWYYSGIRYLQQVNCGVTGIILKMDFTDPKHPAFSIVEHLGTISEKLPIHPDP